jgi:hypothetical protein
MDTTQSTQSLGMPWTKRGLGYVFVFKAIPIPEGQKLIDAETQEPNREIFDEMIPVLVSSPPIFQIIFYKEDDRIQINDIYKCILQGYQDTSDNADLNEKLGLVLDSLRNMGTANKHMQQQAPPGIPAILASFLNGILEEGSLAIGSVVNTESHLCFLKLDKVPAIFLPSSETKLSEQDKKA